MTAKCEWDETVDEPTLSRRRLMRALGGAAGLAAAVSAGVVGAMQEDPTAEPDPEADPEADPTAEADLEAAPEGTPVGSTGTVTIYSGRNETLVGALIAEFEAATGIDAEVRYGN